MIIWNDKVVSFDDGTEIKIDDIRDMTNREISNLLFNIYCDGMRCRSDKDE